MRTYTNRLQSTVILTAAVVFTLPDAALDRRIFSTTSAHCSLLRFSVSFSVRFSAFCFLPASVILTSAILAANFCKALPCSDILPQRPGLYTKVPPPITPNITPRFSQKSPPQPTAQIYQFLLVH